MNPSKDWREVIAPDEEARFARIAERLVDIQRKHNVAGHAGRALHRKQLGGFEARLEILDGLPEPARHGLFAIPKAYEALVRYSNGAFAVEADTKPDVRGIAIKVIGVDGPKVLGTARTQDFLGILQSATPFRDAEEFGALVWASRSPALAPVRIPFALGRRAFAILPKLLKAVSPPVTSLAQRSFYSALPIQCGPYAARFAFVPIAPAENDGALAGPNRLGDDLAARLRKGPIEYAMELQFFVDEQRTPIEDGSVDWPVEVAPYIRVARLMIPQQDALTARGQEIAARIEKHSFDPWHALVEHRPLGGMMRARKVTYFASTQSRAAQAEV